jgi:hypothetical protein
MSNIGIAEFLVILIVVGLLAAVVLIPYWRIFRKAGFQPVLSLLMVIPLVNIITLYYLAFAEWPSLQQHQK